MIRDMEESGILEAKTSKIVSRRRQVSNVKYYVRVRYDEDQGMLTGCDNQGATCDF